MSESKQPQLVMRRRTLLNLPTVTLPEGYQVRSLAQGEEPAWERVINGSFGGSHVFDEEMPKSPHFRPERVLIAWNGNEPAATASAWEGEFEGKPCGYLHMVGTHSSHLGKRLGYAVSLAALGYSRRAWIRAFAAA